VLPLILAFKVKVKYNQNENTSGVHHNPSLHQVTSIYGQLFQLLWGWVHREKQTHIQRNTMHCIWQLCLTKALHKLKFNYQYIL